MSDKKDYAGPKEPPIESLDPDIEYRSATTAHHTAALKKIRDGKHESGQTGGDGGVSPSGADKMESGES